MDLLGVPRTPLAILALQDPLRIAEVGPSTFPGAIGSVALSVSESGWPFPFAISVYDIT